MTLIKPKIIIVEDELIISDSLKKHLEKNENFSVVAQEVDFNAAIKSIKILKPDVVLIDIKLKGEKTGIDIGEFLNTKCPNIVFIYITSFFDEAIIEKVKHTHPQGCLSKPINYDTVQASIEISLNNYKKYKHQEIVEIQDGKKTYVLDTQKIMHIISDKVYLKIVLTDKKITIRNTVANVLNLLPSETFVQINRSCIINRNFIDEINKKQITIRDKKFKVSASYSNFVA